MFVFFESEIGLFPNTFTERSRDVAKDWGSRFLLADDACGVMVILPSSEYFWGNHWRCKFTPVYRDKTCDPRAAATSDSWLVPLDRVQVQGNPLEGDDSIGVT